MRGRHHTAPLRPFLLASLLAGSMGNASAQSARVAREENFRREPNGVVLARVAPDVPLQVVERDGNWTQADLEGWVWLASLNADDSLDLVVAASGGENLRDGPSGAVIGRLQEGAKLEELGREPGWAHVRRRGWIWSASITAASGGTAATPSRPAPASGAAAQPAALSQRGQTPPPPPATRPSGYASVGAGGAAILAAPDGDTLAVAAPDRDLQVVSREGNWVRVRLDGWVWMPPAAERSAPLDATPTTLVPQDLTSNPGANAGRVVAWTLQFISLERAEEIRTDFREGEPFLLTRYGGPDGPFIYVAVPQERLAEVEGLVPLERISVTARVRTGASSLTGTPIVDLLSFEKSR